MCDHCSDALMQKNKAYWERNQLVAYLSRLFESWMEKHPSKDDQWEDEWRNVVFIDLPQGLYSWHIHDSEISYFQHLILREGNSWDGSTTDEKYKALLKKPEVKGKVFVEAFYA